MKSLVDYIFESFESKMIDNVWKDFLHNIRYDVEGMGDKAKTLDYADVADVIGIPVEDMLSAKAKDTPIVCYFKQAEVKQERGTDWDVVIGFIAPDEKIRNNIWIEIAKPAKKNTFKGIRNVMVYRCHGAGLYGAKVSYIGDKVKEFQKAIKQLMIDHLHVTTLNESYEPINEYRAQDINANLMIDDRVIKSDISVDDLKDAGWGDSFMDDRSWIVVDNVEYTKIKADAWQGSSSLGSALSGTIDSAKLYELIKSNKSDNGYKGELYKNNPHDVKL